MLNDMDFNGTILNKEGLYLSALSGGADSTAMLLMLLEGGYKVEAVHCNFHLRGTESDRDEQFCRDLCDCNGVKLHVVHFDTIAYADLHRESIETAARNLRYHYFFSLARDVGAVGVCVAHNKNDQAETMLMNLVRGAGLQGLTGIRAVRKVDVGGVEILLLRPLLNVSRSDIVTYLNSRKQDWVTDSTNLETDATRNKFRLEIIPMLEKINPSAIDNIADACSRLADVARIYDKYIGESKQRVAVRSDGRQYDISKLKEEVSPEAVLFEILNPYGFNGAQIEDVFKHLDGNSGRIWKSSTHQLLIDRGCIVVGDNDSETNIEILLPEDGNYVVGKSNIIKVKHMEWGRDSVVPRTPNAVCLDLKKIEFPLKLRNFRNGDRFCPFGMKGSKLVSDFLTDNKLSVFDKQRQLVLCDSKGNILWVVGRRPDNRYRITSETNMALSVEYD